MKRRPILVLLVAAALAVPPLAFAGGPATEIAVADFSFTPQAPPPMQVGAGTTFHWTRATPSAASHNVSSLDGLFRNGDPTPNAFTFTLVASAGKFDYECEIHGPTGMTGTIRVKPGPLNFNATDHTFQVEWASASTQTGSAFDVRYRLKGTKQWTIWKNDTTKFLATFGGNGKPVVPQAGQIYQFSARSEKAINPSAHSDWSPALSVTTP